jgi:peroxiredoxin
MIIFRRSLLIPFLAFVALTTLPARAALAPSAAEAQPLAVGATAPAVTVTAADGTPFDLGAALSEKPTLLIFYRGGWCPYCNRELGELAEFEPKFAALGYQIIALSTDAPAGLPPTAAKNKVAYRLLSDRAMNAASAYGVAFRVDAATQKKYAGYKIALAPVPGEPDAAWLPVPTAYVIGRDRVIRFAYSNPDFKVRLPAAELLTAASAAAR